VTCYTPLKAFLVYDQETRSNSITFCANAQNILHPLALPCGSCIGCLLDRSRSWAVRCIHEAQLHKNNCFLTLTFNDSNLSPNASLDKSDFRNFMKRLRKMFPKRKYGKISYLMCGEYGDRYSRPHYHCCLFGFDFPDKILWKTTPDGHKLYTSSLLQTLWQNQGYCVIGDVTFDSAAYVARYVTKKIKDKTCRSAYNGRLEEFSTSSRRPAIGHDWLKKYSSDLTSTGYCVIDGKKVPIPRSYLKKIAEEYPDIYDRLKIARESEALLNMNHPDNSRARLNVRYEIQLLKHEKITRSYESFENSCNEKNLQTKTYDERRLKFLKENCYES